MLLWDQRGEGLVGRHGRGRERAEEGGTGVVVVVRLSGSFRLFVVGERKGGQRRVIRLE